jgi:hypothetical protein
VPPNSGPAFFIVGHEDVKGGLWEALRLAPLILLPLAILQTFWLNYPRWPLFSYDDLLPFGCLALRWPNQDLLPLELDHVHIHRERVLVELNLGIFCKFQSSFIYGRLNLGPYLGLHEDDRCSVLENNSMSRHLTTRKEELFKIGTVCFERLVTLLRQGVKGGIEDVALVEVRSVVARVSTLHA